MPYYCDCVQVNRAKGLKIPRNASFEGRHIFQEVQVNKDETCPYCEHYAFFSKTQPLPESESCSGQ